MNKKLRELYRGLDAYEVQLIKWMRKTRPMVHTVLRHVSQSGMLRVIDAFIIRDNQILFIGHLIGKVTGFPHDKKKGVRVKGCGMDMGFHLVYNFSRAIFPDGFKYRTDEYHRNGDLGNKDPDGGYALTHRWV